MYIAEELQASLDFQTINGQETSYFTESFKKSLMNSKNPKIYIVVGKS